MIVKPAVAEFMKVSMETTSFYEVNCPSKLNYLTFMASIFKICLSCLLPVNVKYIHFNTAVGTNSDP